LDFAEQIYRRWDASVAPQAIVPKGGAFLLFAGFQFFGDQNYIKSRFDVILHDFYQNK